MFPFIKLVPILLVVSFSFLAPPAVPAADIYTFRGEGEATYFTNTPGPGRMKVRLPLAKVRPKVRPSLPHVAALIDRSEYEPAIAEAGMMYSVDPHLVKAVIKAESNFDARAVSSKGALGLMQLMPGTARDMNVADPFDPVANIHGGVRYLSQMLGALNGDLPLALAAYNAGPARVVGQNRIPDIRETRHYVERVLHYYRSLKDTVKNRM